MKRFLFMLALALSLSTQSFSQLSIDSFYQEKESYLIYSHVHTFDSLSQEILSTRIKNWAGTNFVNMREVLVSETKEQMVFNYITSSYYMKYLGTTHVAKWYIRMVILIKDNKIKVSFYDDGNVFVPGSYSGGITIPSTPSRSMHFTYSFKDGLSRKGAEKGLVNLRNSIVLTSEDLNKYIKESRQTETTQDNW